MVIVRGTQFAKLEGRSRTLRSSTPAGRPPSCDVRPLGSSCRRAFGGADPRHQTSGLPSLSRHPPLGPQERNRACRGCMPVLSAHAPTAPSPRSCAGTVIAPIVPRRVPDVPPVQPGNIRGAATTVEEALNVEPPIVDRRDRGLVGMIGAVEEQRQQPDACNLDARIFWRCWSIAKRRARHQTAEDDYASPAVVANSKRPAEGGRLFVHLKNIRRCVHLDCIRCWPRRPGGPDRLPKKHDMSKNINTNAKSGH